MTDKLRRFKSFDTASTFAKRKAVETNTVHYLRRVKDSSEYTWEVMPEEIIEPIAADDPRHYALKLQDEKDEYYLFLSQLTGDRLNYFRDPEE